MWSKVSCLRKQHDGRDWASNRRPLDLKSNVLTNTPPHPYKCPTLTFKSALPLPPSHQIKHPHECVNRILKYHKRYRDKGE